MKKIRRFFQTMLTKHMALPEDVLLDLPRITIIGNIHIYVENHQGIAFFSQEKLQLQSKKGLIQILGTSLVIKMMHSTEILIEGEIHTVEYVRE